MDPDNFGEHTSPQEAYGGKDALLPPVLLAVVGVGRVRFLPSVAREKTRAEYASLDIAVRAFTRPAEGPAAERGAEPYSAGLPCCSVLYPSS